MGEIRIIISGSQLLNDYSMLCCRCNEVLYNLVQQKILQSLSVTDLQKITVISGMTGGAALLGARFANSKGMKLKFVSADWIKFGEYSLYIMNEDLVRAALEEGSLGILIVFCDGKSRETQYMIELAKKHDLLIYEFTFF